MDKVLSEDIIRVESLKIGYSRQEVAGPFSFSLARGGLTAMLGKNGIGKSTLLRTISGELAPISGKIYINDKEIKDYSRRELAKLLSIVTTDKINEASLSVERLVSMGRHPYTGFAGRLTKEDKEIVSESMTAVGIENKRNHMVGNLSDGERQKVMIARALAQQTPIILLDEPFSFLDVAARVSILSMLKTLSSKNNVTILFSTHDVAQSVRMAENLILFDKFKKLNILTPKRAIGAGAMENLFDDNNVIFDTIQNDFISMEKKKC